MDNHPDIDILIRDEITRLGIPGLSVAVLHYGKTVLAKGYGLADVFLRVPATIDTVYPIASLSKQFTAAAILILVQDGMIELDAHLPTVLPNLNLPDSWNSITVRNLLNQTSGLKNHMGRVSLNPFKRAYHKVYSPQEVVNLIGDLPLISSPGTEFKYCNTNYFLLAEIVASASGDDFDHFLRERIFDPLGMNSTSKFNPFLRLPNHAARYTRVGPLKLRNVLNIHPSLSRGAGGLASTLSDLMIWDAALDTQFPLNDKSKSEMWTPPTLPKASLQQYGFGWVCGTVNSHPLVWHNGMILGGASCWMGRYVDEKLTVVVLSNFADLRFRLYSSQLDAIGKLVAGHFAPSVANSLYGDENINGKVDPSDLAICEKAIRDVIKGKPDPSMYTQKMAAATFPRQMQLTKRIFKSLGELSVIDIVELRRTEEMLILTARLRFKQGNLKYEFYIEPESRLIAGVRPS